MSKTETAAKATVKLVGDTDNKRGLLMASLLKQSKDFTQTGRISSQANLEADYNIVTGFDSVEGYANLKYPTMFENKRKSQYIYDVSADLFFDKRVGPYVNLLIVSSNLVTCADEFLQEKIYEFTGRLAAIVRNPLDLKKLTKPSITNTKEILWYGSISDIFSIRKYKDLPNLTIACTSGGYKEAARMDTRKKREKILSKFDIIFLPETPTMEGEVRRAEKYRECSIMGKSVVSEPDELKMKKKDYLGIATELQNELIEEESFEAVLGQFEQALHDAPKDDFLDFVSSIEGYKHQ